MPTLAQLNAQAARTREFLQNALAPGSGSIQRSAVNPSTGATTLLGTSPFTEVGGGCCKCSGKKSYYPWSWYRST